MLPKKEGIYVNGWGHSKKISIKSPVITRLYALKYSKKSDLDQFAGVVSVISQYKLYFYCIKH